jgi:secretion/DNA translocation related CpaE-like protein
MDAANESHLARPLIVTRDETLLDGLLRLAAAAGVTPEVVSDPGLLRQPWLTAPMVVVGDDVVAEVDAATLGRRAHVYAVLTGADDIDSWRAALDAGAEKALVLPGAESFLRDRFADTADGVPSSGLTVCLTGGCGGAGASTFAAALGATAARAGLRVLLVDGDPLGGGIDLALGSERAEGARWPDLVGTAGRVSAPSLLQALPAHGSLSVLSWDRNDLITLPGSVMAGVLAAGRRGSDLVVVDLPRRVDASTREALLAADVSYLLVPAEVRAVAAAARVSREIATVARRVDLVVRGPGPAGLHGHLVAETLELPLAVEMRPDRGVVADIDLGLGPWGRARGPLARACRAVLDQHADVLGVAA